MAEQATPLTWLEIVVSWPGAIIAFCVAAIVIFCLLTFSNPLRILVSRLKIKLGGGGRRLEISSADQPAQEPVDEGSTALVKPAATEKADEQLDLEETAPAEGELPLEGDDEITLQKKIFRAGFRDRDPDKIEAVYQKWNALEDRKTSNEVLETLRSRMRLAAGIQAAENELKELEQENATWIDPSLVLTDYFEDLARFDLAEPHAQKAIDRSKTDLRKAHSYRVMADIRIQLGTQADALELLNNAISEVLENEAKARILDKVAEIHEAANDKLMAAKALEHALKLTPSAPTQTDGSGWSEASRCSAGQLGESPVCICALVTKDAASNWRISTLIMADNIWHCFITESSLIKTHATLQQ